MDVKRLSGPGVLFGLLFCVNNTPAQPVWSDEFNGTTVDPSNWEFMIGDGTAYGLPAGWGNNELQYYTSRPDNVYVSGGLLHILARAESHLGHSYTSARLRTRNLRDFRYGRMEARIRLPEGQGIWPAFWMLPTDSVYGGWAASGEIDIMESVNLADTIYGTIHFGGSWPDNTLNGGTVSDGTDYAQGFHVYAIEWEPDVIRWYLDGALYHTATSATWWSSNGGGNNEAPFDQDFHFLLNVAVGGNFPGAPDGTTQFPQEMQVDWVRVHDLGQSPFLGDPVPIPGLIEAENFDNGVAGQAYNDCDTGNNGGAYRPSSDVDIEPCNEGGFNVGWMCQGEWLDYAIDVQRPGRYRLDARVASLSSGGSFHVEFDGKDVTGTVAVPPTGGWQNWTTVSATVQLTSGNQQMRFVNEGTSHEYNVNHFDLVPIRTLNTTDR